MELEEYLAQIKPFDQKAADASWAYWDSLCKPLRGMGMLEEMVVQLAGIYGTVKVENPNPVVVIMGADNGCLLYTSGSDWKFPDLREQGAYDYAAGIQAGAVRKAGAGPGRAARRQEEK